MMYLQADAVGLTIHILILTNSCLKEWNSVQHIYVAPRVIQPSDCEI